MDIKSKKSRPFLVWLCFFIGINIFIALGILAVAISYDSVNNIGEIGTLLQGDLKGLDQFEQAMTSRFDFLAQYIMNKTEKDDYQLQYIDRLNQEGDNLIYYAHNPETGEIITNAKNASGMIGKGALVLPKGYDYYLYYDGEKFFVQKEGKTLDPYQSRSLYRAFLSGYMEGRSSTDLPDIKGCQIFLVVKKDIVEIPYGGSSLYELKREMEIIRWVVIGLGILGLTAVVLLVIAIIKRRSKRGFDRRLAAASGFFWIEVKAMLSIILLAIGSGIHSYNRGGIVLQMAFAAAYGWWIYLMLLDIRINGKRFFANNSINWLIKLYRSFESKKPFQKAMLLRVYALAAAEAVLVLLAAGSSLSIVGGQGFFMLPLLGFMALGVYLLYRYLRRYSNTVSDIGKIMEHTQAIRNGDMTSRHFLDPGADLYSMEDNLNRIQESVMKAAEERVRSERTKVELITNVSHDLKTPLTSIISYVDLLSKEENLPEHVKDYITILSQKSDRLKILIQDLFDLSKVAGGDMEFERERLDLGKLVQQTLGDMEEQVAQSGLALKVSVPDEPAYIISDGKKLYRVFQNLFSNALKYSLAGSRVYVDLTVEEEKAAVVVKNIASYEMNFKEEEILERFVRGDKARSTEGSGLGLAIAQNFTQACGGSFGIQVDGDLFKVQLSFPIVN